MKEKSRLFCSIMNGTHIRSFFKESLKLEHPEAVASIILAATSCHIENSLHHLIIKVLHDLFLHSDQIKMHFLQHNAIEFLCSTLVILFEHKIAVIKQSIEQTDGNYRQLISLYT
jgi:hypothetical protein